MTNDREWVEQVIIAETKQLASNQIRDAIGSVGEELLNRSDMANMISKVMSGPSARALRKQAMENIKRKAAKLLATIGQMKKEESL